MVVAAYDTSLKGQKEHWQPDNVLIRRELKIWDRTQIDKQSSLTVPQLIFAETAAIMTEEADV